MLEPELAPTVVATDITIDADALDGAVEAMSVEEEVPELGSTTDVLVVILLDEFTVMAVDVADATELLVGDAVLMPPESLERLVNKGKLVRRLVVDEGWLTDEVTTIETY